MKPASEFVENLSEVFALFGPIEARRMFGGYGIFRDGRMFALVADDVLYLKADRQSAPSFSERGLSQFEYQKGGRTIGMSYYMAPEEIFDDPEHARQWAARAHAAALRARKAQHRHGAKKN